MQVIVDKALLAYQKKRFFDSLDLASDELKNDPETWNEEQQERQAWGITLLDKL